MYTVFNFYAPSSNDKNIKYIKTQFSLFQALNCESSYVWLKGHIQYLAGDLVGTGGSDFANGRLSYSIFLLNIVTPHYKKK